MRRRARAAAAATLENTVALFERIGGEAAARASGQVRVNFGSGVALLLQMTARGRVFGGVYALEISTADPVLPRTRGLEARGRGVVRLRRVSFRPKRGDPLGAPLAKRLEGDDALQGRLASVHFERIRVDPDGRPVIRHMGGSIVWILFPPLVRPVPFIEEQARATVAALEAFAAAGASEAA